MPLLFDLKRFYRIAACLLLTLGVFSLADGEAWAKSKKPALNKLKHKQKTKLPTRNFVTSKQKTVAPMQLDPATEFEVIDEDAIALNNVLAVAPDNAHAKQKMAELALRALRSAEKALSRGDEAMFAAYSVQFHRRFADTRAGLEAMAARGIGAADYALGALDLHGFDGEKDIANGCLRFAAAVDKGFGGARFRHAQCIEESEPAKAFALIRDAADGGHVAANERLGRICLEADPPDAACAQSRLERAARDGRASATTLLGWMQAEGIGSKPDPARAAQLYLDAARKGEASASNNLGELHEKGRGIAKNEKAAFSHYLAAAKSGFPPGQFNVGRLYAAGRGTQRDPIEARRWLLEAEKAGIPQARAILQLLESESE